MARSASMRRFSRCRRSRNCPTPARALPPALIVFVLGCVEPLRGRSSRRAGCRPRYSSRPKVPNPPPPNWNSMRILLQLDPRHGRALAAVERSAKPLEVVFVALEIDRPARIGVDINAVGAARHVDLQHHPLAFKERAQRLLVLRASRCGKREDERCSHRRPQPHNGRRPN